MFNIHLILGHYEMCSNDTEKYTDDSNDETDDEPEADETDKESPPMMPLNFSCTEESSDSLDPAVFNNLICDNSDSGKGIFNIYTVKLWCAMPTKQAAHHV